MTTNGQSQCMIDKEIRPFTYKFEDLLVNLHQEQRCFLSHVILQVLKIATIRQNNF